MGSYFTTVCQRAIQKRKELEADPSTPEQAFTDMRITEKFLSHKTCFATSQPLASLVVLKFLGYTDDEIREMYFQLVYEQCSFDPDTFQEPESPAESTDHAESTEKETVPPPQDGVRYYQFEDGTIFKIVNGTQFYVLNDDNIWIRNGGDVVRKYFDPQYGWWEINRIP